MPHEKGAARQIKDAAEECGIEERVFIHFVQSAWIEPVDSTHFDEEDISRARLIHELQNEFGVNEDAIPIILHLVDQLNALTRVVKSQLEKKK